MNFLHLSATKDKLSIFVIEKSCSQICLLSPLGNVNVDKCDNIFRIIYPTHWELRGRNNRT